MTPASIVPAARPELTRDGALELLRTLHVDLEKPALLGRRGYYRDAMGVPGLNDIGIYDDAIFYVSPTAFSSFNANTDPSRHFPHVATLKAGVWRYKLGIHNASKPSPPHERYKALVQAAPVTVVRQPDDAHGDPWEDTGYFGINVHKGGYSTTSSEGCQTIHPSQWPAFIGLVDGDMQRHQVLSLPYALTEREDLSSPNRSST